MDFNVSVIESVGMLILLILLTTVLRKFGALKEDYGGIFAKIVTLYTLPALIFESLSQTQFDAEKLWLPVVMIISQLACALIALGISNLLKLSRPKKGALILASTFTSSGFLGYAVIKEIYGQDLNTLSDAAYVSELGVATLIFTLGVLIAIEFGTKTNSRKEKLKESLKFFYSPIFIALILGIAFSFVDLPKDNYLVQTFYKLLRLVSVANTLLVTLTIGVLLKFKDLSKVLPIVLLACIIKLIVQPILTHWQAEWLSFPDLWYQIVIIESAMPTAALTAVFSKKYGCDTELTTILIFATFISSIFTIIMMVFLLG